MFLMTCRKGYSLNVRFIVDTSEDSSSGMTHNLFQKTPRNLHLTKHNLKENRLIAVPFDQGIGICLMPTETYKEKIKAITDLPQFEKVVPKHKNEKHPVFKEEEKVIEKLKELNRTGEINDKLYEKLRPTGSQAPRLYGLGKVHKPTVPLRPVLSMPGSPYHSIAEKIADWLKVVKECNINTSSKEISDNIVNITLDPDEEMT